MEVPSKMGVWRVELDYCAFGEAWKKPTAFVTSVRGMTSLARRCSGTFRCCSRAQKPRQELRGKSPCGLRWTQLAC
eukprot:1872002-Pyramimonas_sp.AAC.1